MSLREEIKHNIGIVLAMGPFMSAEEHGRLSWGCADAALAALRPHEAVQDSKPLILYFPTDEDRDEFIKVVYAAKPDMTSVKV